MVEGHHHPGEGRDLEVEGRDLEVEARVENELIMGICLKIIVTMGVDKQKITNILAINKMIKVIVTPINEEDHKTVLTLCYCLFQEILVVIVSS
jgi:hypothetical protein